jgi:hypothetical protein
MKLCVSPIAVEEKHKIAVPLFHKEKEPTSPQLKQLSLAPLRAGGEGKGLSHGNICRWRLYNFWDRFAVWSPVALLVATT